jgi:hypothetical protein
MSSKNNTVNKFAKNQETVQGYVLKRLPLLPPIGMADIRNLVRISKSRSDKRLASIGHVFQQIHDHRKTKHQIDFQRAAEAFAKYSLAATCSRKVALAAMLENDWIQSEYAEEEITNFQAICKHTTRLLDLSLNAGDWHSPDRVVYLGQALPEVIAIGEELDRIGGFDLMQAVASEIPYIDQRELDYAWDGIGGWLC